MFVAQSVALAQGWTDGNSLVASQTGSAQNALTALPEMARIAGIEGYES